MGALKTENIKHYYPEYFSEIDMHFARFISELSGGTDHPELFLASALLSRNTANGHVCLDLSYESERRLSEKDGLHDPVICPKLSRWTKTLKSSPVVGSPGDFKPIILDGCSRLYLYRYWQYEQKLAAAIKERASFKLRPDAALLKTCLNRLFPGNEQKLAAFTAVMKNLVVICGGPGTGKSTTVAKILALLIEVYQRDLIIKLAAPTGKAADRLQEAVKKAKEKHLKDLCPGKTLAVIPDSASTIHRMLGAVPGSAKFSYNSENQMAADVVVIDEASMVDLPLMSKLFQATRTETKIIILGDKDQLASVESGAVLGDICNDECAGMFSFDFCRSYEEITEENPLSCAEENPAVYDCIAALNKNYRFGPESGIGRLSAKVNEGAGDSALELLKKNIYPDISWLELPKPVMLAGCLEKVILKWFGGLLKAAKIEDVFCRLELFRILCALREGPFGVEGINRLVEKILAEQKIINTSSRWYHGRPIIITRNDYNLKLFNGDTGIIWKGKKQCAPCFFSGSKQNLQGFCSLDTSGA